MRFARLAALALAATWVPVLADDPLLRVEYRVGHERTAAFDTLSRTSLLYGRVTVRATVAAPWQIDSMRVVAEDLSLHSGEEPVLCRSSAWPRSCTVDIGRSIARRRLRIEARIRSPATDASKTTSRRFSTLDTHPVGDSFSSPVDSLVERTRSEAPPPDDVVRLLRVERVELVDGERRVVYEDGLDRRDFRIRAAGIRGARILSMRRPDPDRPKLIPILFNVSGYLKKRARGHPRIDWREGYTEMVSALVAGLRTAARRGVDAEYLVLPYAATGRCFGPFRLTPGPDPDDAGQRSNEETLERLTRFLTRPPPEEWQPSAGDDFGSLLHTLNDLYLREYDGLVQAVWITGGWSAGSRPRFQDDLWPERLAQLNPVWSESRLSGLLERLDRDRGAHDEALLRFVGSFEGASSEAGLRVAEFLRGRDRGGTRTLQPHRVDSSPMLNVLLVPGDGWLRASRMMDFVVFVRESYGGRIFRSRPATVAQVLQVTHEQLRHSYVASVEVPNPHQNGALHTLRFDLVDTSRARKSYDLAFMPHYTSSRSALRRLADYLGSPIKELRLLSAYELRRHWSDERLDAARIDRWQSESDPQVRGLLFESWVAIQLKRLQAETSRGPASHAPPAALARILDAAEHADRLPDPELARRAARAADWYREAHGSRFGE